MINDTIFQCVQDNKSVLVYKEDVQKFLPDLSNRWTAIFIGKPVPPKEKLVDLGIKLGLGNKDNLKRQTIEELKEVIENGTKNKKIVILFNHFERLTQIGVDTWDFLNSLDSIILVASFSKNYKAVAYTLSQKLELIKQEKHEEIDIKYSIFAIIAGMCIFSYMKIATLNMGLVAYALLATIWFGLIIFRTLIYVGRG